MARHSSSPETVGRRKLLSLNFFPTFHPPRSGGEQRAFHLLDALARSFDVVSLTPTYSGTRDETVRFGPSFVEERFAKTAVYQEWHAAFRKLQLPIVGSDLATALSLPYHPAYRAALQRHLADADIIVLQHPVMVTVISDFDLSDKRVVYLSHNCEFELASQSLGEPAGSELLTLLLQLEARLCRMADDIAVVGLDDARKMQALYGVDEDRFLVVGNGSACRFEDDGAFDRTRPGLCLFVGSNWKPNVEAARFIVDELAPACPDLRFAIAGSVCRGLSDSAVPANVELDYELDDAALANRMSQAAVALNPMRSGGGSNVKIADYLAHGLRVLTTETGLRGFPQDLANVGVADHSEFAHRLRLFAGGRTPTGDERRGWQAASRPHWDWTLIGRALARRLHQAHAPVGLPLRRHVVFNEFPVSSSDSGGEARIAGLFSAAAPDERFVILAFGRKGFALRILSDRVVCLEIPATAAQVKRLTDANRGVYASVNDIVLPTSVADNQVFLAVAATILGRSETIVFSHPFMWPVYEHLALTRPALHDSHNIEGALKAEALETHPRGAEFLTEVRRQERAVAEAALLAAACSPADAAHLSALGTANVMVAQNGVVLDAGAKPGLASSGAHDAQFFERRLYFVEEFDECSNEIFVDTACRAVLKRPATIFDAQTDDVSHGEGRARFLVRLMRGPENARRILVMGALRRTGAREITAVFMGSGHRPNLTAAQIVAQVIAPARADDLFLLLGQVGASLDPATLPPNVFVSGFVDTAMKSRALWRCDVGLNPMVGGGGSNLKVPDYLAHGLPVLSTRFGARGFELAESDGLFQADVPGFAAALGAMQAEFAERPFDPSAALQVLRTRYGWDAISRRFLKAARAALEAEPAADVLIVVEDAEMLRAGPYSPAARLIADVAASRPAEAIVQSDPLDPHEAAVLKRLLPATLKRASVTFRDRELFLSNASRLAHDNLLGGILDVVEVDAPVEAILDALERCRPVRPILLSGAGNPVEAAHPWRFVTDRMLVALPSDTLALVLAGKAHRPAEIRIEAADGTSCGRFDVAGSFEIRCLVDTPLATIRTRICDPVHDIGSCVPLQINRLGAETGTVERSADLWSSAPAALHALGLSSRRRRLSYGRPIPPLAHETLDRLRTRAATVPAILAIGSAAFSEALRSQVATLNPGCRVAAFDGGGLRHPLAADKAGQPARMGLREDELGLVFNEKERGFLARARMPQESILLLAESINGEILRFAAALKRALGSAGVPLDVSLLTTLPIEEAAPRPPTIEAALREICIIQARSDREMIALLGRAELVVMRGDPLRFGRVPLFLDRLGVPAAVWRTGEAADPDPFATLETVSTVSDVLALVWSRRSEEIAEMKADGDEATTLDVLVVAAGT